KRSVRLADLSRYTVAIDDRTGTTTPDLWAPGAGPARIRTTHGVDEWLTLIAAGQAIGLTSEATAHQNPRPGVAFRAVRDAPAITVLLAWRRAADRGVVGRAARRSAEPPARADRPRPCHVRRADRRHQAGTTVTVRWV